MSDILRWAMHQDAAVSDEHPAKGAYLRVEPVEDSECPDVLPLEWECEEWLT